VLIAVNISLPNERLIRGRLSALPFLTRTISDDDPTLLLIGEATRATAVKATTEQAMRMASPAGRIF
jgi:uroporphyrin-III C-methyltransferase